MTAPRMAPEIHERVSSSLADVPVRSPSASISSLTFEPGVPSARHTHPQGQTLIVTAGCGRTPCQGEPIVEMRAGNKAWCPPGHKQRHGATPATLMAHIANPEALAGQNVHWLGKVGARCFIGIASLTLAPYIGAARTGRLTATSGY